MNSLPLPLPNFTLKNRSDVNNLTSFSNNSLATAESSAIKLSNLDNNGDAQSVEASSSINSMLYSRRDAIGLGLVFSFAEFSFPHRSVAAADGAAATTCQFTSAISGLAYCDSLVGSGASAEKGQLIKAHYVGKLENGKVFDSSYSRGKPLTFRVGVGEVIKGWDEGILGGDGIPPMLSGGKRTLRIPPELGYGIRGAGCKGGNCIIPPNSVLLFDVEYIGKA